MADSIFTRIMRGEIPGQVVHEDDLCIVLRDINPQAPTHLLVIPRKPIPKLSEATAEDQSLLGHLMLVAGRVAREVGAADDWRLVVNNGAGAGQTVFHLHLHVLAGRPFGWPPG
jgi:histidine triad (HIT) family protein